MSLHADFVFLGTVAISYGLGVLSLWVGTRHTYWAWTGQYDRLTTVVAGPFAESADTRVVLWKVGGSFCVLAGVVVTVGVTYLLLV